MRFYTMLREGREIPCASSDGQVLYPIPSVASINDLISRGVLVDLESLKSASENADDPLLIRGVLVRHLALPGCGQDSRAVLRYLHETYGDRIFISIMNQYTPMPQVFDGKRGEKTISDPNLCRHLTEEEYDALVDYAIDLGIQNGFIQESGTVSPSYIPVFDGTGILSQ